MIDHYASGPKRGKRYVRVYNNTGSSISNGAIKVLVEAWISGKGVVFVPIAPATNSALKNVVAIIDNNPTGGIAAGEYGNALVEGQYGGADVGYGVGTTGTITANDQLEVLNNGTVFQRAGTSGDGLSVTLSETCAVSVENVAANVWAVYLIGQPCEIKAT